jgi:hypothetical protein
MKDKVFFLVFHGFSRHNGISKKIWGQVQGLKENGIDVTVCYYSVEEDGHRVWKIDDDIFLDLGKGILAKIRKRIEYEEIGEYIIKNRFSLVYIRSDHNSNPFTINFVKNIRRSGMKVVMEIPTFPYDQEYDTLSMRLKLAVDKLFRRKLAKQLNALITFSNFETIFGQKTIQISNGINFNSVPLRKYPVERNSSSEIHLLAVAEVHYWHGFDRIIHGINIFKQQNPTSKVIFHLVGEIEGIREQREILIPIQQFGLQNDVILHGYLWGEKLDKLFDLADFAIGSLGRHRSGIKVIRTLKNREYAARGIPFIYSESDPDFDDKKYIIKASEDDSPINILEIVSFLNSYSFSPASIRESIGELSWKNQMGRVLDSKILC